MGWKLTLLLLQTVLGSFREDPATSSAASGKIDAIDIIVFSCAVGEPRRLED